jgi:hypothetical protein
MSMIWMRRAWRYIVDRPLVCRGDRRLVMRANLILPDRQEPVRGRATSDVLAPGGHEIVSWRDFERPQGDSDASVASSSHVSGEITYGDASYAPPAYVRYTTEFTVAFSAAGAVELVDQHFAGPTTVLLTRFDRLMSRVLQFRWRWRARHRTSLPSSRCRPGPTAVVGFGRQRPHDRLRSLRRFQVATMRAGASAGTLAACDFAA